MNLKASVFEKLSEVLSPYGFSYKKTKDSFVRQRDGVAEIFQLVCRNAGKAYKFQPNMAVRVECVEDIFHRTSEWDSKSRGDTPTIGISVGNLLSGDSRACEFLVEKEEDVSSSVGKMFEVFQEFALPYFEKFGSLEAIDAELNEDPGRQTLHRPLPWLRCSTGIIVAKLLKRSNYDEISKIYSEKMKNVSQGFYYKKFENLLNDIEQI